MNNEPIAYQVKAPDGEYLVFKKSNNPLMADCTYIPLYTHPAKTLTEIIEKNKPEIEKANAYIKSLKDEIKSLKAKTLTDEEIKKVLLPFLMPQVQPKYPIEPFNYIDFARAILKKAQEK